MNPEDEVERLIQSIHDAADDEADELQLIQSIREEPLKAGDAVATTITGYIVNDPNTPDGAVCVQLRHPRHHRQLMDIYLPIEAVVRF